MNKPFSLRMIQLLCVFFVSSNLVAVVPVKNPVGLNSTLVTQWALPQQAAHSQNHIFAKKVDDYTKHAHRIIEENGKELKNKIKLLLGNLEAIEKEVKQKINHANPIVREQAFNDLKEILYKHLATYPESLDKTNNIGFQQARALVLIKIIATIVDMARGSLIRAIGSQDKKSAWFGFSTSKEDVGIEAHLAYWKTKEKNIDGWFWNRNPLKMFSPQKAKAQAREHINALQQQQDKYYEILGTISKEVDKFKIDASISEQYAWIASLLATINAEIFNKKSENNSELTYAKLRKNMLETVLELRRFNETRLSSLLAKHNKPHYLVRNWMVTTGCTIGAAAFGFYLYSQSNKFPDWYKKLQNSFNYYVAEPLKDMKQVLFGDEQESKDDVMSKLTKETDRLDKVMRGKEENRADVKRDFEEKIRKFIGQRNPNGDPIKDANGRIILDEARRTQLENALNNLKPVNAPRITVDENYITQAADDFVRPENGNIDRAMNILQVVFDHRTDVVGQVGDRAHAVNNGMTRFIPGNDTYRVAGFVNGPLRQEAIPALTDIITTLKLMIHGYTMQGKEISDSTYNIMKIVKEEADALLAQSKRILRANRATFTISALLPSIAALGIMGWGGKKMLDKYRRIDYSPIRLALVEIGQLLNRYEDINSTNRDFEERDYGKLVYLLDRLRNYNEIIPTIHRDKFKADIESLEMPITAHQKMRIIDLMYRNYDFLSPRYTA